VARIDNKKDIKKKKDSNKKVKEKKIEIVNDNKTKEKELYTSKEVIIVMIFSIGIGILMCFGGISIITGKNYLAVTKDLKKVVDTYYAIVDNYYGELDRDKLIDGAVEGMISSVGDTFTSYSDTDSTSSFDETINGSYEGIGCTVATLEDGTISVIDKSKIVLTVKRDNEEKDISINLSKVEIPHVSGKVIEQDSKKIGYIKISLFASNSYKQFKNKLDELEKSNIDDLIIDVRDNSGGYLSSVTDICNLFLDKGKVIYQLEDSKGKVKKKDTTKEKRKYDIVVLINGGSASASEILASAIKESYGGDIVGTNSYGKGTVQQTKKLLDGSMIKYTTQKWLTPDGNSINEVGVTPTKVVELNEEYFNNPTTENDNQLQEAIKLILE